MFQDTVQQIVQKIFKDKILLGLIIVCLLAIFVGGFNYKQEKQSTQEAVQPVSASQNTSTTSNYGTGDQIQPDLAVQFVKWWLKPAMDYTPASAVESHRAATNWMTAEASRVFNQAFWSPDLAQQVASGAVVGAFQPIAVQAEAINPDHSIVVGLAGTLVLQTGSRPTTHQIQMDVLVRKGDTGLRVAGLTTV